MRLFLSAVLLAIVVASMFVIFVYIFGPHSTEAPWVKIANYPGAWIGIRVAVLTRSAFTFYMVATIANSAFYFTLAKAFVWLRSSQESGEAR